MRKVDYFMAAVLLLLISFIIDIIGIVYIVDQSIHIGEAIRLFLVGLTNGFCLCSLLYYYFKAKGEDDK